MEKETGKNYEEVLNKDVKQLHVLPAVFEYSSEIMELATINVEGAEARVNELENKDDKDSEEKRELKSMQNFINKVKDENAERDVIEALIFLLNQEKGFLLHSYKPERFLQVFTDKVLSARRNSKYKENADYAFTDHERKIIDALNFNINDSQKEAKRIICQLNEKANNGLFLGATVIEAIKQNNALTKDKKMLEIISHNLLKNKSYDAVQLENALVFSHFLYDIKPHGEMDVLLCVPSCNAIMNVEVKRQLNADKKWKNFALKKAAIQMNKHSKYVANVHGSILSDDWNFIKIAAILPGDLDRTKICKNCEKFIITTDKLKSRDSMKLWWNRMEIEKSIQTKNVQSQDNSFSEFSLFFTRLIGFESLTTQKLYSTKILSPWEKIHGPYGKKRMSSGEIPHSSQQGSPSAEGTFEYEKIRAHHASKIIYFSREQQKILSTASNTFRLVFFSDFGSGNF